MCACTHILVNTIYVFNIPNCLSSILPSPIYHLLTFVFIYSVFLPAFKAKSNLSLHPRFHLLFLTQEQLSSSYAILSSASANFTSLLNHSHQFTYAVAVIYSILQNTFSSLVLAHFPLHFHSKAPQNICEYCLSPSNFLPFSPEYILIGFSTYHFTKRPLLTSMS